MYGNEENVSKAVRKKHMIFSEAGQLAKGGGVKELWLTHFSPSLTEPEEYVEAAKMVLANTLLGRDPLFKSIKYEES